MATPALKAIRAHFSGAHICFLMRSYVADILEGTGFANECMFWPASNRVSELATLIRAVRSRRFGTAILLTNSFKSAMVAALARIPRRIGYARDGRSWLLTDRVRPIKENGKYVPEPAIDYYNRLAARLGCPGITRQMQLATTPADEAAIDRRLGEIDREQPLVVLNPGANYGSAKCWPPEKYAFLADELGRRYNARVVASLGPKERHIADAIRVSVKLPIEVYIDPPLGLGPLKALIRRSQLLITNDTGPRHIAPAFNVPVVTIFGSSDPAWTLTYFDKERSVMHDLDCRPCMQRVCPLGHHHCMKLLEAEQVLSAAEEFLSPWRGRPVVLPGASLRTSA